MSDSVRPHRRQPTGLPRPWDSPGKNTGVGCHFLLQCMKVKSEGEVAQSCPTPCDPMDCSTRLLRPWDFPGKSTGVGCQCLLHLHVLGLVNSRPCSKLTNQKLGVVPAACDSTSPPRGSDALLTAMKSIEGMVEREGRCGQGRSI